MYHLKNNGLIKEVVNVLNYIAKNETKNIIQKICVEKNILVLYETHNDINIEEYIKRTNVNFNVLRYFIIDLECIIDLNNFPKIISQLKIMYPKIRIIVMASYNNNYLLLEQLYQLKIYNIVDTDLVQNIEKQMLDALSEKGIQKKQVRIFDKKEQEKILKKKENKKKLKFKTKNLINFVIKRNTHKSNNVYFFLLELITKIVKLIIGILFFILTSIGITVLFNEQLRNLLIQIFNN